MHRSLQFEDSAIFIGLTSLENDLAVARMPAIMIIDYNNYNSTIIILTTLQHIDHRSTAR